jgi:hypothetical protein
LVNERFEPILSGSSAISVSTGSVLELAADNGDALTFDPTLPDAETHLGGHASHSGSDLVNTAFLTDFISDDPDGTFTLSADVDQLLDFGGVGGISGQFEPVTAIGNVIVTYEYVPEPSGWAIAFCGLVGLLRLRRRFA